MKAWLSQYWQNSVHHTSITNPWILQGGKNGYWKRNDFNKNTENDDNNSNTTSTKPSYIILYSAEQEQLRWIPAQQYPGIPASRINMNAMYSQDLPTKLIWFNSQVSDDVHNNDVHDK